MASQNFNKINSRFIKDELKEKNIKNSNSFQTFNNKSIKKEIVIMRVKQDGFPFVLKYYRGNFRFEPEHK